MVTTNINNNKLNCHLEICIELPSWVQLLISEKIDEYNIINDCVNQAKVWQFVLSFIDIEDKGEELLEELKLPLLQFFVPTVFLSHIGEGKRDQELWAFAQITANLKLLKGATDQRLFKIGKKNNSQFKKFNFLPHIMLGKINKDNLVKLPDKLIMTSFPVHNLIIQTREYIKYSGNSTIRGYIKLDP